MSSAQPFFGLHRQAQPLLIGNAWDLDSALAFEKAGFQAIATSSLAVAQTAGYEDRQQIPFDLLLETVKRIRLHTSVPLSVDMEAGYSDSIPGIIENIDRLYDLGVAGINLEDSIITTRGQLQPVTDFQKLLTAIKTHLDKNNRPFFINARTDAFLYKFPAALDETVLRAKAYEEAGASGIFVPFMDKEHDIIQVVQSTSLPVNVFCTPGLPHFSVLADWGVKRISMGGSLYKSMKTFLEYTIKGIREEQSFGRLFPQKS